jgi:hypothetical protein
MKYILTLSTLIFLFAFSISTYAITVDFNSAIGSPDGYSDQGVAFSYNGTGINFFATSPNGSNALAMSRDLDAFWRADITGGASMVSVDLGDFGEDADQAFLSVFDSTDNLLGTTSLDIGQDISDMFTLSLLGNNISYATFGTTDAVWLGGLFADNFTYTPSVVPVPAAAWLFGSALLGFAGLSWKKKQG